MTEIRRREQPTGNVKEAVVEDKRGVVEYTQPPQNRVPPHQRQPATPAPKQTRS
jgi:hypothetical protein